MPIFTQNRFPFLWKSFQYFVGGTVDKRKLCVMKYRGQQRILEIGCSVGNIAETFQGLENIKYTGIDIDPVAIAYARKSFKLLSNFRFLCIDIRELILCDESFDYILFAGVMHHVCDEAVLDMCQAASRFMRVDAVLVIVDPLTPESEDSWLSHFFANHLEHGQYMRREAEILNILQNNERLKVNTAEIHWVGATPLSAPKCAKFGVYELLKKRN